MTEIEMSSVCIIYSIQTGQPSGENLYGFILEAHMKFIVGDLSLYDKQSQWATKSNNG